jgi:hypothetical protein
MQRCQRSNISGRTRNTRPAWPWEQPAQRRGSARSVGSGAAAGAGGATPPALDERPDHTRPPLMKACKRPRIVVLRQAGPAGHGHDRLSGTPRAPRARWRPLAGRCRCGRRSSAWSGTGECRRPRRVAPTLGGRCSRCHARPREASPMTTHRAPKPETSTDKARETPVHKPGGGGRDRRTA